MCFFYCIDKALALRYFSLNNNSEIGTSLSYLVFQRNDFRYKTNINENYFMFYQQNRLCG